jgi:DNA-binding MarR family transcriptional regulator
MRSISDLESHLGYWLRYVSNHVSHAFARKLEGRDVSVAEWVVMRELYSVEGMAPSCLADKIGMTRGAVSKLSERLARKGLVTREASAVDGRAQTLSLTTKARNLIPKLAAAADQNDAEFFDDLAPEDRKALLRILRRIVEQRGLRNLPVD